METVFSDWRFLVFAGTIVFNIGAIWAGWQSSRREFRELKADVKDLKVKVLNGITSTLAIHTNRLTAIEVNCAATHHRNRIRDTADKQGESGGYTYGEEQK